MGPSRPRNATSARKAHPTKRHKPAKLDVSPTDVLRETRDGMPVSELRHLRNMLEVIQSSAIVVARALQKQNALVDDDAARVLRHHVSDALMDQIQSLDKMLKGGAA